MSDEPATHIDDEFHGQGGSYEIRDGKRVRVEEPTAMTATGGARDADGKPLDLPPDAAIETTPTRRIRAVRPAE